MNLLRTESGDILNTDHVSHFQIEEYDRKWRILAHLNDGRGPLRYTIAVGFSDRNEAYSYLYREIKSIN